MEYLEELSSSAVAQLGTLNPVWAYAILFLSAFLENVIPPVPGDAVAIQRDQTTCKV